MNARSAQWLAASLGFVLIVLVGAVIFILLSRPPQGPRPSPSLVAAASLRTSPGPSFATLPPFSAFPTATLLPTQSAIVTPPPTGTPEATPTVPPTPSPSPTAEPTPTATPVPNAPDRQLRVSGLGLDARDLTGGVERFLVFNTDGPTTVRARVTDASGPVRVCLWQGTDVESRTCKADRIRVPAVEDVPRQWTLSLIGADETSAPTVDLTLDFNAHAPSVEFQNLRFQGTPTPAYNGLTAALDTLGPGTLGVSGTFDPGEQHAYHILISEAGVGPVVDEQGGPAPSFSRPHPVTAQTSYVVQVTNPSTTPEPGPVFLHLTIGWP